MEELGTNLSEKAQYDYRLVKRAVEHGDQQAYSELMDRYHDSIFFMLLKMVNNRDDADDLTIEAFGKAFNRLHQYTPSYAFSTWLFKIASNNCIDFIRKKKKNVLSLDKNFSKDDGDTIQVDVKSGDRDPEEEAIRKQKHKLMHEVVDRLKPRYRELVELRYFKEYSYDEISEELGIPLGTVKAQLFRAREFLYNILKNSKEKM